MSVLFLAAIGSLYAIEYNVVTTYSANGTDLVDDTTAFQSAITAASNNGGVVVIPAGTYYISASLTNASTSKKAFSIRGEGNMTTKIIATTNNWLNLISLDFPDDSGNLTITDVTLSANVEGYSGTAVQISYPHYPYPRSRPPHMNPGLLATRVHVTTDAAGAYWAAGIQLTDAWNCRITDCTFSNKEGDRIGNAIWLRSSGTSDPVQEPALTNSGSNNVISNCCMNYWACGVYFSEFNEGLFIDQATMVDVNCGVASGNSGGVCISIKNSHIDARGSNARGIAFNGKGWFCTIQGILS